MTADAGIPGLGGCCAHGVGMLDQCDACCPPAADLPPAWVDLLEGLTLLATHQNNIISPLHCEHDTLTVMADPSAFTDEQLARLAELGFFPSGDAETFCSYRFGSA